MRRRPPAAWVIEWRKANIRSLLAALRLRDQTSRWRDGRRRSPQFVAGRIDAIDEILEWLKGR